ncbi:hypothetical protein CERSUDRAFT_127113 [Gelatoporia subvermispora B]|uniref:Uncharacterized protein n=1 Tax=Ceriporiopsis subvermispora (strain B) TaxID=914234 RepID=M2R150_CERS8|nr:hypothetical protein CERSUDRAFT_127113 [Gelatoporia subvermispora B]
MDANQKILHAVRHLESESRAKKRDIPKPRFILQGIAFTDVAFAIYQDLEEADDFLEDQDWAESALREAFRLGNFDAVKDSLRNYIKPPEKKDEEQHGPAIEFANSLQVLRHSFLDSAYLGNADEALFEWLTENEIFAREATDSGGLEERAVLYGRFATLVQATGCGKTRTLLRLGLHGVFVIYMNLRSKDDLPNYPPRDSIPTDILRSKGIDESEYGSKCCTFFIALFDVFRETLEEIMDRVKGNKQKAAQEWYSQMCLDEGQYKDRFFGRVKQGIEFATQSHGVHGVESAPQPKDREDSASASQSQTKTYDGEIPLGKAYTILYSSFPAIFDHTPEPKVVIVFDEADSMRNPSETYSPADVLCRVISSFSRNNNRASIWTLFASTESKIADFAAPSHLFKSTRVSVAGERIVVPFTSLGWDQMAPELGGFNALDVAKVKHMMLYGRPLWAATRNLHQDLHGLEAYARQKLINAKNVNLNNPDTALVLLAQRFCLHVAFGHPDAVEFIDKQISTNMRICVATTEDRIWRYTPYPSEPLLSHIAAKALHSGGLKGIGQALTHLRRKLTNGMVSMGSNGELVSRVLWLLGKDLAVHDLGEPKPAPVGDPWDIELQYCRMVPVTVLIEKIFHDVVWPSPDAKNSAMRAFKDAYVNFSHWVAMDEDIDTSKTSLRENYNSDWNANEWLLRLWTRSAAIQCAHQQKDFDKVIPVYFRRDGVDDIHCMSYILASDKLGTNVSTTDLNVISRSRSGINSNPDLPYMVVLIDLGNKEDGVTASYPTREGNSTDTRCLRLRAKGIKPTTYGFLADHVGLAQAMHELTLRGRAHPHKLPKSEDLQARFKFGSTLDPMHMTWERRYRQEKPE